MAVDAHYHSKTDSSDEFDLQLSDDSKDDGSSDIAFIDKSITYGPSSEGLEDISKNGEGFRSRSFASKIGKRTINVDPERTDQPLQDGILFICNLKIIQIIMNISITSSKKSLKF